MDVQIIATFAGLCAVFVAACILTVASSTYVNAIFNELIRPADAASGPSAVFKVEVEDSGRLRDIASSFAGYYFAAGVPLVVSLSGIIVVCGHSVFKYGYGLGDLKATFFPQSSDYVMEFAYWLPPGVVVSLFAYPFLVISRVWTIKRLYVKVMKRHAETVAKTTAGL